MVGCIFVMVFIILECVSLSAKDRLSIDNRIWQQNILEAQKFSDRLLLSKVDFKLAFFISKRFLQQRTRSLWQYQL